MSDKELLEMAAKAAGIEILDWYGDRFSCRKSGQAELFAWNPLTDDGDALRLAVKLYMSVMVFPDPDERVEACSHDARNFCDEAARHNNGDPYAATRRAIVRAAAELGRNME